MCGIAGILNFDGAQAQAAVLERMADSMAHRGPDDHGAHVDGPAGLAHRRLSIIDLSPAGRQPMCNEDRTVWVTANGEIYNFAEIRRELETAGHHFSSNTDTEVIVHAYEEWGIDCLSRFNGMFAFGLWDSRKRRLWLVRDRIGIKPLFYTRQDKFLAFGSEIKSILADPRVERRIDRESLAYYVALNWTPAPNTLLAGIRQLLGGHYLLVEADGRTKDVEYWKLDYDEGVSKSAGQWLEEFDALMEDATRLRLVSDVPFGAFLSGGLDSSAVAYWMSRRLSNPVQTFSIGFEESSYDETPYAISVAERIGAEAHKQIVTAQAAEILPQLVWHAEEPTADSSMVGVYYLAREARKNVTMVLTGDGADEILAGYETYQAYYMRRLYRMLPGFFRRRVLGAMARRMKVSHSKVSLDFKLRRFIDGAELSAEDAHASWRMIFGAQMRSRLLSPIWNDPATRSDVLDVYRSYFAQTNASHPLNRMLYVDTRLYLPNDMLTKVDRMTMAHSLEARVPFLDHRVVEFCATVPPGLKLKGLRTKKHLLKTAMRGRLPKSVIKRRKEGFNQPVPRWISEDMKPFVLDTLSGRAIEDTGLLNAKYVGELLSSHFDGSADNSHQIWCVLTLVLWYDQFMRNSGEPAAG
ncbi:MAG: asparagine synthase (glutamine-hydrolyzing) [Phycisphaerae bacterium]|jgi:asparagine synthase (glutamine-hydrolysing)|nr:asparagine synthase (glutamine-hydrolyzing) [Phycisphaerae bacterium]